MPQLVLPDPKYKQSYLAAREEYIASGLSPYSDYGIANDIPFTELLQLYEDWRQGKNMPEHFVPATHFWLVEGDIYLGESVIRHTLTEYLRWIGGHIGYVIRPSERQKGYGKLALKLILEKAKEMGFKQVLVTCMESNLPSRKIIEANHGVYEGKSEQEEGKPTMLRFWIATGE